MRRPRLYGSVTTGQGVLVSQHQILHLSTNTRKSVPTGPDLESDECRVLQGPTQLVNDVPDSTVHPLIGHNDHGSAPPSMAAVHGKPAIGRRPDNAQVMQASMKPRRRRIRRRNSPERSTPRSAGMRITRRSPADSRLAGSARARIHLAPNLTRADRCSPAGTNEPALTLPTRHGKTDDLVHPARPPAVRDRVPRPGRRAGKPARPRDQQPQRPDVRADPERAEPAGARRRRRPRRDRRERLPGRQVLRGRRPGRTAVAQRLRGQAHRPRTPRRRAAARLRARGDLLAGRFRQRLLRPSVDQGDSRPARRPAT